MKAMIFAAGLGTRLRPLTDDRPKALVELDGRTLLEIVLARLREFHIREVVINVHHFADKLVAYLEAHDNFGMRIELSREDVLLDTGGGLKKAAHFFLADSRAVEADEPIVVHNVDVLSTIDLARMAKAHAANKTLATLAVQDRKTSRYLLFDDRMCLCGRRMGDEATAEVVRPSRQVQPLAFAGIHIVSPRLLTKLTEDGAFSIIMSYLRLANAGETIAGFRADGYYWRDLGRPEDLKQAAEDLKENRAGKP
ncbi:MAG: nucleotidyltransferase family protein [Terriglobales bacterium]